MSMQHMCIETTRSWLSPSVPYVVNHVLVTAQIPAEQQQSVSTGWVKKVSTVGSTSSESFSLILFSLIVAGALNWHIYFYLCVHSESLILEWHIIHLSLAHNAQRAADTNITVSLNWCRHAALSCCTSVRWCHAIIPKPRTEGPKQRRCQSQYVLFLIWRRPELPDFASDWLKAFSSQLWKRGTLYIFRIHIFLTKADTIIHFLCIPSKKKIPTDNYQVVYTPIIPIRSAPWGQTCCFTCARVTLSWHFLYEACHCNWPVPWCCSFHHFRQFGCIHSVFCTILL